MKSPNLPAVSFASLLLIAATLPQDPLPGLQDGALQDAEQDAEQDALAPIGSETDVVVQQLQDLGYASDDSISGAQDSLKQEFVFESDPALDASEQDIPSLEDGYQLGYDSESAFDDRFLGRSTNRSAPVYGKGWPIGRLDTVFPAGLERTQIADVGRFSFGVRASRTEWEGNRDSRTNLSTQQIFDQGFTIAGTDLLERRLEVDAVYGLNRHWTLFATLPFIERELTYEQLGTGSSSTSNSGLGDIILGGRYTDTNTKKELLQYSIGLEIPTGDYDERGNYAGEVNTHLPFPLQIGTGSFRLQPGASYVRAFKGWSLGLRGEGRIHLDRNSDNWAVGDSFQANVWAATAFTDHISGNVGLQAEWRGDYHGDAPELDFTRSPLEDESRQGGSLLEIIVGLGADLSGSYASANRIDLEIGFPVDEWLSGPGLSRETSFLVSWKLGI